MADTALSFHSTTAKAAFGVTLVAATTIPLVSGGIQWLVGPTTSFPLQPAVALLAAIHVPMTVYLLFDPGIRRQMYSRPLPLIVMPLLIFAAVFAINFLTIDARKEGTSTTFVYFTYFVLVWNLWHFGKQNIGVYSFFRASQNQSSVVPLERKLLLGGAVLGALSAFAATGDYFPKQYAKNVDMNWFLAIGKQLGGIGTVGQVLMVIVVLFLLWSQRQRHSWASAVMFFLSTNFFFSYYLLGADAPFVFIFTCSTFAHGLQYLTFLGFHAGTSHNWSRLSRWVMPVIFVVVAASLIDLYQFNLIFAAAGLGRLLTWVGSPDTAIGSAVFAFNVGVLLIHFWLDSYFWRFKDANSRTWMSSRFGFVLKRAG
jgi:hypothetical protein